MHVNAYFDNRLEFAQPIRSLLVVSANYAKYMGTVNASNWRLATNLIA